MFEQTLEKEERSALKRLRSNLCLNSSDRSTKEKIDQILLNANPIERLSLSGQAIPISYLLSMSAFRENRDFYGKIQQLEATRKKVFPFLNCCKISGDFNQEGFCCTSLKSCSSDDSETDYIELDFKKSLLKICKKGNLKVDHL